MGSWMLALELVAVVSRRASQDPEQKWLVQLGKLSQGAKTLGMAWKRATVEFRRTNNHNSNVIWMGLRRLTRQPQSDRAS